MLKSEQQPEAQQLISELPENWRCEHGHTAAEHRRCWDRTLSTVIVGKKVLAGWSEAEVMLLLAYRNPNKKVFQIKDDLWKKFHSDRSLTEITDALDELGIRHDAPKLTFGGIDIESTNLNARFGFILGYYIKVACEHDQAGPECKCGKLGRGSITMKELAAEYGDAYLSEQKKWAVRHVCHCKERYYGRWISKKDVTVDKKLGYRPKDLYVIKQLLKDLKQFDVVFGHNSERFDLRFIKSRALIWQRRGLISDDEMRVLDRGILRNVDTLFISWDNLALGSARQEVLVDTFHTGIKTKLSEEAWNEAVFAEPWAVEYVEGHCRMDVDALEKNYYVLRRFAKQPYGRPV